MSKRVRPWDKGRSRRKAPPKSPLAAAGEPYVTVDGQRYYSDRFYLIRTTRDKDLKPTPPLSSSSSSSCQCGAGATPLLLDRSRLVESLELRAAVLATFNLDTDCLVQAFPSLCGPNATVPTLVLHGDKSFRDPRRQEEEEQDLNGKPKSTGEEGAKAVQKKAAIQLPTACNENNPNKGPSVAFDDDCDSLATQDPATKEFAVKYNTYSSPPPAPPPTIDVPPPPTATMEDPPFRTQSCMLSKGVSFGRVKSTWIRPQDIPTNQTDWMDPVTGHLSQTILKQREDSLKKHRQGVHHPKYMLLFEKSGSVVVVVMTGNLSWPRLLDAAWVQRFPAAAFGQSQHAVPGEPSDFGQHLSRMLQWQMLCLEPHQVTPLSFLQQHAGFQDLHDLDHKFDYRQAQAHLIVTVPGDHEGPLYGRQRVSAIVNRLAQGPSPTLPSMTAQDTLIVQPTSLGAQWTTRGLAHLVQSYLPDAAAATGTATNNNPLNRLEVIWPTATWMNQVRRGTLLLGRASPDAVVPDQTTAAAATLGPKDEDEESPSANGVLFLSSEAFNSISLDCLTCMTMYEPSDPAYHNGLVPHFKSVCRVLNDGKNDNDENSVQRLAWFYLTSACLSRGAQGHWVKDQTVAYANFECGVLFCSRAQGKSTDRIYAARATDSKCRCHEKKKWIHLPIPYKLRGTRYAEDEDDDEFVETPYFHEIPPGTACTGNMTLTPYGRDVADKLALGGR